MNTGGEVARSRFESRARIGGSAAIASRWPHGGDEIPPATQARISSKPESIVRNQMNDGVYH